MSSPNLKGRIAVRCLFSLSPLKKLLLKTTTTHQIYLFATHPMAHSMNSACDIWSSEPTGLGTPAEPHLSLGHVGLVTNALAKSMSAYYTPGINGIDERPIPCSVTLNCNSQTRETLPLLARAPMKSCGSRAPRERFGQQSVCHIVPIGKTLPKLNRQRGAQHR